MTGNPAVLRTLVGLARHSEAQPAGVAGFQDALLRRLVRHAYARVPYYRALYDRTGVDPRRFRGRADLHLLPVTDKRELRLQPPEQVVARGYDRARLLTARTSGSSGEPFAVRRTWAEGALQFALRLRAFSQYGGEVRDRVAAVGLKRPADPRDPKLGGRALRALGFLPPLLVDGLAEPAEVARRLREFRPGALHGMPGMLCRVAAHLLRRGEADIRPRFVVVGGEVTTPRMREQIRDAFDAPVYEIYGSHEFPLLAWECVRTGALHVCDDGVLLEVLRADGTPAQPGERGEVVATNLHSYAMPLIRYRLGDVVTRGAVGCACGQPFSTIRAVQGRMIDYYPLPDGRVVHPYEVLGALVRGDDSWIAQYQLLQERRDRIVLRVLPLAPPAAEQIAGIERIVRPLLGHEVHFSVLVVDDLPLEGTGKFRPSRSLVSSEHGTI